MWLPVPGDVRIRPPRREAASVARARSMPAASRRLTGKTSNPTDDATAWMTPNWAIAEGLAGSRSTAARVTLGATCLSNSGHFPLKLYSNERNPGGVAAWSRQTLDEAGSDRIRGRREHDRHRAGQLSQWSDRRDAGR